MKAVIAILFLAAAVLPTATMVPQSSNRVSIELGGVTVWLGMPRTQVIAAVTKAGYKVVDNPTVNGEIFVSTGAGPGQHAFVIRFNKAGLLSYADRNWYRSGNTPIESALGALETVDGKRCTISHQPIHNPDMNLDRVFVFCDSSRTILITYGKIADYAEGGDVIERIESE